MKKVLFLIFFVTLPETNISTMVGRTLSEPFFFGVLRNPVGNLSKSVVGG